MKIKLNSLPLILSVVVFMIVSTPFIVGGLSSIFYGIDPDIMYLGNALSWIKMHQIHYIDHPGTPAILLLSLFLVPFRILAKFFFKTPFISWALENHDIVFMYSRIVQSFILSSAIYLFLTTIFNYTRSKRSVLIVWLAMTVFTPFFFIGGSISPEATSFLLVTVWIYTYSRFLRDPSPVILPSLSLLAGISIANKFTNLSLGVISPLLILTISHLSSKKKIANFFINSFIVLLGFISGTWVIRKSYPLMFRWVTRLATTSDLHGGGTQGLFNWDSYKNSALSLTHLEAKSVIIVVVAFLLITIIPKKTKSLLAQRITFIVALVTSFIFAKYPLSHYHLANYLLIIFLLGINIPVKRYLISIAIVIFLIPSFYSSITRYRTIVTTATREAGFLHQFVSTHPSTQATIWEWGRSFDMALLWGRGWAGSSYDPELINLRPSLHQLKTGFQSIAISSGDQRPIFDVCWDYLYIQEVSTSVFLEIHPNRSFEIEHIPNTKMNLIVSNHCLTKP